jgi:uncharacterized protein YbjT (DUF2867 family)
VLLQAGRPVRAADLNVLALRQRFGVDLDSVHLDFGQPETYAAALSGVKGVFLVRPPAISDVRRYLFPFIAAAAASGVRQVAFLSLIGIEQNPRIPHYPVEQALRASGMAYTFLRCSFFMQNLSTTHREEINNRREIFIPAGSAKTSFIDVRDIAAAAATVLSEAGHENRAYELTGGEALDYDQVAALFSQVLGVTVTYRNPSLWRYFWSALRRSRSPIFAGVTTWLYASTRRGMAARLTGDLPALLGRPPITLRQFIEDYRAVWL